MVLKSFSKINLTLNVNKKLKNNFHDIQSYYCQINLYDSIKIRKINGHGDKVKFLGKFKKLIDNKNNSVLDTLKFLRKNKIISSYFSVIIDKKIPVYSGLGGGTGNAITIFKHFIKKKDNKMINSLCKFIGTDSRLFFYNQGFLKNLNSVIKLKKQHKFYFLLIYPNIKSPTKMIYSKVRHFSRKIRYNANFTKNKRLFENYLKLQKNDLQLIVENKHLALKKIIAEIYNNKGCAFSRMTGSGSVCYGMFQSKKLAKKALNKLSIKYSRYWMCVAKTI